MGRAHGRNRILGLLAALLGVAALVVGCGGTTSSKATSGQGAPFQPKRVAGIQGGLLPSELKLWKYDRASGKYVVVPGDASKPYTPHIERPSRKLTVAYDDGYGGIPFTIAIKRSLERIAKDNGIQLFYCDTQFKPEKAISCAEQQALKKPDFAIESNFQSGAATNVMKIWDQAKIPAVNIDVWHPNGIFFGANNYESGLIGGRAAGEFAKRTWGCKDVWTLYGESPGEGKVANERGTGFVDGVQEVCGTLSGDNQARILLDAGSTDQGITKTTDWLTGHPQAKHILATSIDDARAFGMAKAFKQNQRDGYGVGIGCDTISVAALKQGPASATHMLGCVAYFPERYPEYLVSIMLDVLAGKPVPQEVHIKHEFLNQETIRSVYP
jgi:ribose transport system substrate-binding protein